MTVNQYQSFDYGVIDCNNDDKIIAEGFNSDYEAQRWIEDNKKNYPNSFLITTDFH
jgi:hypothetical protein